MNELIDKASNAVAEFQRRHFFYRVAFLVTAMASGAGMFAFGYFFHG